MVTGRPIRQLVGHGLTSVNVFAADGKTITSLSADGTLTVWGVASGKEVRRIRLEDWRPRGDIAISPDRKMIAAGSPNGGLTIWEATAGKQIRRIPLESWKTTYHIAFSPDGKTLASASVDDTIHKASANLQLWDIATGKEKFPYPAHQGQVFTVAFSPDDKMIASAGGDCTLRLWDVATGKQVRRILDGPLRIWDVSLNAEDRSGLVEQIGPTGQFAFSPDGRTIISAGRDGTLWFWDVAAGTRVRRIDLEGSGPIEAVAFAPDRKMSPP